MQFKFILPVSTKFLCSVCFLTQPVFGHLCDYIAHTKKQHNMATPSMTLKVGGFQHGDGVLHIKALAFARPRHGLRSAMEPGTFSIQTLLLYFRHSHSLLFILSFIVLSLDQEVLISGGKNARGKIMCLSF